MTKTATTDMDLKKIFFNVDTETEQKLGGAESKGDTESEAGSRQRAVSTQSNTGLELTNCKIMT